MKKHIIDVREPSEYANKHAPNAINIPLSSLVDTSNPLLEHIELHDEIVLYCNSGNRSELAVKILKKHGYSNVKNGINQIELENSNIS